MLRFGIRPHETSVRRAAPASSDPAVLDIGIDATTTGNGRRAALPMAAVVAALTAAAAQRPQPEPEPSPRPGPEPLPGEPSAPLGQDALWAALTAALRPGDTVVVDQGSAHLGMTSQVRPAGVQLVAQSTWLAIGWSLPVALGMQLADPARRTVVVIGDGALALTVQELSTLLRSGCAPLVVVVNNAGYLIEDVVAGHRMPCNDLWVWRYRDLPAVLDASGAHRPLGLQARTVGEFDAALTEAAAAQAEGRLVLLEAVVGRDDRPAAMRALQRVLSRDGA